jgi:hypothetical protein
MLTSTDYLMAWSVYLFAALAFQLAFWRWTRGLWSWVRDLLRVALAVLVFTPAAVDGASGHYAPAVYVVAYELLTAPEGGMGALIGVRLLLVLIFAVIAVLVLRLAWHWLVASRRAPEPSAATPTRAATRSRPA